MELLPPAATDWGFGNVTDALTKAVGLYTSFNTMKSNQALSSQQLELQLAAGRAQLAQINASANTMPYTPPAAAPSSAVAVAVDYGAQAKAANSNKILYIGGGIVALVGVLFLVRRK
jgi:hypothetical protein